MLSLGVDEFEPMFAATGPWALLAGSAVSVAGPTNAPTVGTCLLGLIEALEERLESELGEPAARALHSVFRSLDKQYLQANLKLEVALSHLDAHRAGSSVELVEVLYKGLAANSNHVAVASLVASGHVAQVLTTNFDGGFERTGAFRRVVIGDEFERLDLVKIHGDAESGRGIIATMEGLTNGRNTRLVDRVLTKLMDRGISDLLVVGYSGRGDIDIRPALLDAERHGMRLWWAVRDNVPAPYGFDLAATISHDLLVANDNLLLRLARTTASDDHCDEQNSSGDVRDGLRRFTVRLSCEEALSMAVALILESNFGWQAAKLLLIAERASGRDPDREQWSLCCERMSAYSASAAALRKATASATGVAKAAAMAREGFLLQEAGRISSAGQLFHEAVKLLQELKAQGDIPYSERDFVERGLLEWQIERCMATWRPKARRQMAASLRAPCKELLAAAIQEVPAVAEVLKLRLGQIEFLAAASGEERGSALREVGEALAEAMSLQHADGEAVARRFLVAAGAASGRQIIAQVESRFEARTERPAREGFKARFAGAQAMLPMALQPWKLQLPLVSVLKYAFDLVLTGRLRVLLLLWAVEFEARRIKWPSIRRPEG